MRIIDETLLDQVSARAAESPRLRRNHNLHASDGAICHRLLNGMEPGSYIRPHRHLDPAKDESVVILRGRLGIVQFDGQGRVERHLLLTPGGEAVAVDIPSGTFHMAVSLEPGTVFFEAKAGPYLPLTEAEVAPWAPAEGSDGASTYLEEMLRLWRDSRP